MSQAGASSQEKPSGNIFGEFDRGVALSVLERAPKTPGGIVKYATFFQLISLRLPLTKRRAWSLLRALNDDGRIVLVCGHGIRLCSSDDGAQQPSSLLLLR